MVCTFFLIPAVDISICSGNYGALGSSNSFPSQFRQMTTCFRRLPSACSSVMASCWPPSCEIQAMALSGQSGTRERLAFRACLAAACGCPCIAGEQADAIALALDDRRALFRGAIFPRRDRAPPVGMHAHTNAGQAKDLELAPAYQCATWSQRFQGPQFSPNWDLDSASPRALAGRLALERHHQPDRSPNGLIRDINAGSGRNSGRLGSPGSKDASGATRGCPGN